MNKRAVLFLSSLILTISVYSQQAVLNYPIDLGDSFFSNDRKCHPYISPDKDKICLFLVDKRDVAALFFNSSFQLIKRINFVKPLSADYSEFVGCTKSEDGFTIYFLNSSEDKISVASFNISTGATKAFPGVIKFDKERFIEGVELNNKFYLLTVLKKTSKLKLFEFKTSSEYQSFDFDFSANTFINGLTEEVSTIYHALKTEVGRETNTIHISKIPFSEECTMLMAAQPNKFYYYDKFIVLTFDHYNSNTQVITINVDDHTAAIKRMPKEKSEYMGPNNMKSNSYLYKNYFFSYMSSSDDFKINVYDFETRKLVKTFYTKEKEEIAYKNTPICLEKSFGQLIEADRELTKTKQFLRKLYNGGILSLGIYEVKDGKMVATIGAVQVPMPNYNTGNAAGLPVFTRAGVLSDISKGVPVGQAYRYDFNPYYIGYYSQADTKNTYFKGVFNETDLSHLKEDKIEKTIFDLVEEYEVKNPTHAYAQTIFRFDNHYYYGRYTKGSKKYTLFLMK